MVDERVPLEGAAHVMEQPDLVNWSARGLPRVGNDDHFDFLRRLARVLMRVVILLRKATPIWGRPYACPSPPFPLFLVVSVVLYLH